MGVIRSAKNMRCTVHMSSSVSTLAFNAPLSWDLIIFVSEPDLTVYKEHARAPLDILPPYDKHLVE